MRSLPHALVAPLLVAGLCLLGAPNASGGPSCTGCGGSTIQLGTGAVPELLDLYTDHEPSKPRLPAAPGSRISTDRHPRRGYVELIKKGDVDDAFHRATAKLDAWASNSPALVALIDRALHTFISVTDQCFARAPQYVLPPSFLSRHPETKIETAILFIPGVGPIIAANKWNSLDVETQAGLLIHEALRQVQHVLGYPISDRELQTLAATVASRGPSSPAERLEDGRLGNPRLLDFLARYQVADQRERAYVSASCNALGRLLTLGNLRLSEANPASQLCPAPPAETPDTRFMRNFLTKTETELEPQPHRDYDPTAIRSLREEACTGTTERRSHPPSALWFAHLGTEFNRCLLSARTSPVEKKVCKDLWSQAPIDLRETEELSAETQKILQEARRSAALSQDPSQSTDLLRSLRSEGFLKSCEL